MASRLHLHDDRYFGKYRGTVVASDDDQFQGTLQVRVPDVFGPDAVVAAAPCLPYGHFFVPPPETAVWVEFEAGDAQRPIWAGVWYPTGSTPEEAKLDPPQRHVIKTKAGHTIEIDDTADKEQILIRHSSNAFVSISPEGNVLISNAEGSHLNLDAKKGTAGLVEQHGNHLAMGEKGSTLVNPDGTMINVSGKTVHVSASSVILDATSVALGASAAEPTILGNAFSTLWTMLLTHMHPTAAPGPPSPSPQLAAAQLLPGVHLSSSVVVK
jgi:hypothetical protein